jgi:hypothetical protein
MVSIRMGLVFFRNRSESSPSAPTACNATHNTIFASGGAHLHVTSRILTYLPAYLLTYSPVWGADEER